MVFCPFSLEYDHKPGKKYSGMQQNGSSYCLLHFYLLYYNNGLQAERPAHPYAAALLLCLTRTSIL
jgi:hypothetical protein